MKRLIVALALMASAMSGAAVVTAQGIPCRPYNPQKEDPPFCAGDHRINKYDAAAPITAYCQQDNSIDVWSIIQGKGYLLYNVSAAQLVQSLQQAEQTGQDQLIQAAQGRELWALHSGELELHADIYYFVFPGDTCGTATDNAVSPASPEQPVFVYPTLTPTPLPEATQPAQDSIPAPAGGMVSVTTGNEKLHDKASPLSNLLGYVPRGSTIAIFGRDASGYWVKVIYRGTPGWVSTQYAGLTLAELRQIKIIVN